MNNIENKDNFESPKGFISAPSLEQLKPTEEEKAKLLQLFLWLEASKLDKTIWH